MTNRCEPPEEWRPILERVLPMPEAWFARCPACNYDNEGISMEETHAGSMAPVGDDRYIRCGDCDTLFEVCEIQIVAVAKPQGERP